MGKAVGRKWGDKKPFAVVRKWREGKVRFVEYEADFWEGALEAGEDGQYHRRRLVHSSAQRLPNVSFAKELEAALK